MPNILQSFSQYTNIDEVLITFGKKAYPKFGHVVILAGGAGSGKGFIKDQLLGIEGKTFDVDELKNAMLQFPKYIKALKVEMDAMKAKGLIDKVPVSVEAIQLELANGTLLKDPNKVMALHAMEKKVGLAKMSQGAMFKGIAYKRPPNIIFDVTLKSISKLITISQLLVTNGYDKKNIHIVWVANDIKIAIEQNAGRKRVVPHDILVDTHKGASRTMADIITMGKPLQKYMDGNIYVVPNKRDVNSKVMFQQGDKKPNKIFPKGMAPSKGQYFVFADYYKLKDQGKPVNMNAMTKKLEAEIRRDVPKDTFDIKLKK